MLGTRVQFGRGEDRFYPAKARSHNRHRNLQRSRSCGSTNGVNGGFGSSPSATSTWKSVVPPDREPENVPDTRKDPNPAATAINSPSGNLDRFLESTTPSLPAQFLPRTETKGWRNCAADHQQQQPYFLLGDLWESFKEWSAYGTGVPLLLNDTDLVMQYYVPYLSAIQLYVEHRRQSSAPRRPGDESDSDIYRDSSSSEGSSDCELDINRKPIWNSNLHEESSSDDQEPEDSESLLLFEFLERDLPYSREPLADKISDLSRRFPELKTLRSCDLLPCSWISVAWYPIYRIPTGPTLRDLDACFLTFHSLSTPSTAATSSVSLTNGGERISLPSFGLASYKMMGKVWEGAGCQLARSLMESADSWLRHRHVAHPDYQFFSSHSLYIR